MTKNSNKNKIALNGKVDGNKLIELSDEDMFQVQHIRGTTNFDSNGDELQYSTNLYIDIKDESLSYGNLYWLKHQVLMKLNELYQPIGFNGGPLSDEVDLDEVEDALDKCKTIKDVWEYVKDNSETWQQGFDLIELNSEVDLSDVDWQYKVVKDYMAKFDKFKNLKCMREKGYGYARLNRDDKVLSYNDVAFILAYLDTLDTLDDRVKDMYDAYNLLKDKLDEDKGVWLVSKDGEDGEVDLKYYLRLFLTLEYKRLSRDEFNAKYAPTKDKVGICSIDSWLCSEDLALDEYAMFEGYWFYENSDCYKMLAP